MRIHAFIFGVYLEVTEVVDYITTESMFGKPIHSAYVTLAGGDTLALVPTDHLDVF